MRVLVSSANHEGMHDSHTQATFQAFVDAVIPPTLRFAQAGVIQIPGALNLCIHDYVIWDLDHSQYIPPTGNPNITPLSKSTAILLDLGAEQFIRTSHAVQPQDGCQFPGGRLFSTLSRSDRLRTVMLLDRLDISLQRNGITVDPSMTDEHGPIPKINYSPGQKARRNRDILIKIAAEILQKAGAKKLIWADWPPGMFIHLESAMRMGFVINTDCEAYQVKRLYIADNSGHYNGIGGANPTLTTQALATRMAEKLVNKYFS